MLTELLKPLTRAAAPFTSVSLDATRKDRAANDHIDLRWAAQARHLESLGAARKTIAALGDAALEPTGRGGDLTRLLVAAEDQVLLDLLLPGRPVREESAFGPAPHLMPAFRALSDACPYAVARVDRAGAELEVVSPFGLTEEREEVVGEHDVVHKVSGGGWAQKRYQTRVEDSWERNAAEVAKELDKVVRRHRPDVVLVEGDEHAIAALLGHAGSEVRERAVRLGSGGRAVGTSEEAERAHIRQALDDHRDAARRGLLDRFAEQLNREQDAVDGLGPVVEALRRGQVATLVLHDDPSSTAHLWVGAEPLQMGLTEQEARAAGAEHPRQSRADAALTWALVGSDAELLLVGDAVELRDGIGALLRWSDQSNERLGAPSMPGPRSGAGDAGEHRVTLRRTAH